MSGVLKKPILRAIVVQTDKPSDPAVLKSQVLTYKRQLKSEGAVSVRTFEKVLRAGGARVNVAIVVGYKAGTIGGES